MASVGQETHETLNQEKGLAGDASAAIDLSRDWGLQCFGFIIGKNSGMPMPREGTL